MGRYVFLPAENGFWPEVQGQGCPGDKGAPVYRNHNFTIGKELQHFSAYWEHILSTPKLVPNMTDGKVRKVSTLSGIVSRYYGRYLLVLEHAISQYMLF